MKSLFSFVNSVIGGEEAKEPQAPCLLPWDDFEKKARELGVKGPASQLLKEKIFEIADDEANFLRDVQFEFEFDRHIQVILELMKIDQKLSNSFRKLVPSRRSEDGFWKSYFYQVEVVKDTVLKHLMAKSQVQSDRDILDELESELIDEPVVVKRKPVAMDSQMKEALDRISALEACVKRLEAKIEEMAIQRDPQIIPKDTEL